MPAKRKNRQERRHGGYVSMRTLADDLEVSERTVRRWIADGLLPAYRLPGERTLRVQMEDVEDLLRRIPTTGDGAA